MPVTTYNYTIAADFPAGKLHEANLKDEITASSITIALDGIARVGDGTVDVRFKDALPAADKTTLDGDTTAPCGGLIAAHNNVPPPAEPQKDDEGVLFVKQHPQKIGLDMCDRDIRLNTCDLTTPFHDKKVNVTTKIEDDWGEITHVGVFKSDGTACADQADADLNGVVSVWDYAAIDQADGTTKIPYDIRGGSLLVDAGIPAVEAFDHRVYVVAVPDLGQANMVRLFDGYLGGLAGKTVEALSPSAKTLDPGVHPLASVLRVYIYHPAGAKRSHMLRLITYRATGTF